MLTDEKIKKYNQILLEKLSLYINLTPRFITPEIVSELVNECGLTATEAVSTLLAAALGLDIDSSNDDRELFFEYFPEMISRLDTEVYENDPYYVGIPKFEAKFGEWEFRRESYAPYELFVWNDLRKLRDGRVIPQIGFFEKEFDFPAVLEGGREWMTVTPNEIETMREAVESAHGRVLTFGLGLGYFAYMAARCDEVESVTVVERDREVIELFHNMILPLFPAPEKIRIIEGDAFEFADRLIDGEFDLIYTDIWHDPSDGVELYRKMKSYEQRAPHSRWLYWIEPTLKCYM